jgi:hypothetical protein
MRQTFANAHHFANFAFYVLMEIIQFIPLCTRRLDDRWAWHYEKNGILTVRSAYRLFVQIKHARVEWLERRIASSDMCGESKAWLRIWSSKVPPKIRVFLWRLARLSIPIGDVRCRRNMAESSSCSLCGVEDSWRHSLVDCTVARCVWALADEGVTEQVCMTNNPSARLWLAELTATLSHELFARVVVTL